MKFKTFLNESQDQEINSWLKEHAWVMMGGPVPVADLTNNDDDEYGLRYNSQIEMIESWGIDDVLVSMENTPWDTPIKSHLWPKEEFGLVIQSATVARGKLINTPNLSILEFKKVHFEGDIDFEGDALDAIESIKFQKGVVIDGGLFKLLRNKKLKNVVSFNSVGNKDLDKACEIIQKIMHENDSGFEHLDILAVQSELIDADLERFAK